MGSLHSGGFLFESPIFSVSIDIVCVICYNFIYRIILLHLLKIKKEVKKMGVTILGKRE